MINAVLLVFVLGVIVLAFVIDAAVLVGWLRRAWMTSDLK